MFDLFTFTAAFRELENILTGEKIKKVYQPFPRDILINFNNSASYGALLISCNPSMAGFHLTKQKYKQPSVPPSFCMLLRKYLEGARIHRLTRPPWERILEIHLSLGTNHYKLTAELMGRHSNMILTDEDNIIRGVLKPVTSNISRKRVIVPGRFYAPPPLQDKISPEKVDFNLFGEKLSSPDQEGIPWKQRITSSFRGIGPLQAEEIAFRARDEIKSGIESDIIGKMWEAFECLLQDYHNENFRPVIAEKNDGKMSYTVSDLSMFKTYKQKQFDSVNKMLDYYYNNKIASEQKRQIKDRLYTVLGRELKKNSLKEKRQKEDLKKAEEADRCRLYGEILLAHLHLIKGKSKQTELPDLYHPERETIVIPLDPRFSAKDNAQKYFQRYRKLQKGEDKIKKRLSGTQREKKYLESVLFSLENADKSALEQIQYELMETGYIKKQTAAKAAPKNPPKSKPRVFTSASGYSILVGLNNMQNDEVTFNMASRNDTWFHVQKLPGSHVVVKGSPFPPDEETLTEAATLAAYYSKAKQLPNVTVDYTQVKHVKRAPGNKPGMAIYKNFSSIIVSPEGGLRGERLESNYQG